MAAPPGEACPAATNAACRTGEPKELAAGKPWNPSAQAEEATKPACPVEVAPCVPNAGAQQVWLANAGVGAAAVPGWVETLA